MKTFRKIMTAFKAVPIKVKNFFQLMISKCKNWANRNFKDTGKPQSLLTDILTSTLLALMLLDSGLPEAVSFLLAFVVFFLLLNLLRLIVLPLLKMFLKISPRGIYLFLQLFIVFAYLWDFSLNSGGEDTYLISRIAAIALAGAFLIMMRCCYALFRLHRKSPSLIIILIFTLILTGAGGYLCIGTGFSYPYVNNYLAMHKEDVNSSYSVRPAKGPHETSVIDYGMNKEPIKSRTANLSSYVVYEGFTKKLRDFYWGYSIDKVPLKGRVWYPADGNNYPVVFIVHGNHTMTAASYKGYGYLGEYLASYGYVVVSVDESFLNGYINNGLSGENDARAILLLKNMEEMERKNKEKGNPLYEKMDFNNLTLAGHSRGGEAVTVAALYNSLKRLPDNGNISLSYDFDIKSIIAIAPCTDQYRPSNRDVSLTDVNYLLIHGANDQDVSYMMGEKQYNNTTFTGESDYFKAYLYIADANHGQFNTKWGRFDIGAPFNMMLNTKNLLKPSIQQDILKLTVKQFLDATIKEDVTARNFFRDSKELRSELPVNLYLNGYEDSSFDTVCNYEEDTDITTATKEKVRLSSSGSAYWYETQVYYELNGPDRDNYALIYAWKESVSSYYDIAFDTPYSDTRQYLQFNVMDDREYTIKDNEIAPLDFTVRLTDSKGETAVVTLSDYAAIYPSLPVMTTKLQFFNNTPVFKHYFQTVRLPLEAFQNNNNNIDTSDITDIRFIFNKLETGNIKLDNIGFAR
jgi:dienelactone hydrolase